MDCVNHPGVNAAAYCQNCGRALCGACTRREPNGQVLCDPCWAGWHAAHNVYAPPVGVSPPGPNPVLAAVLGFIPGVGAMYNGQFLKGFLHVIVFAVLVSIANHVDGVFGLVVAAWIAYQVFDAFHTAKARRDGLPLPDPLGINEMANWITGEMRRNQGVSRMPTPPPGGPVPPVNLADQPPASAFTPSSASGFAPPPPESAQAQSAYQTGYQPPPFTYGAPPPSGFVPGYVPPSPAGYPPGVPPVAPALCMRREPIAAIVLIAMGVLFLLGQFSSRVLEFTWPVVLIALGVWLAIRRMRSTPFMPPSAETSTAAAATNNQDERTGDDLPGGLR